MRITAMVIFILIGSTVFTLVFRGVDGDLWIEHLLTGLPGGAGRLPDLRQHLRLLPRLLPRFLRDRLHHHPAARAGRGQARHRPRSGSACCSASNMQTSFMHPPFGFALFYLRGIAPTEVKSSDIYWGAIPWVVLQLILVRDHHRLAGAGDRVDRSPGGQSVPARPDRDPAARGDRAAGLRHQMMLRSVRPCGGRCARRAASAAYNSAPRAATGQIASTRSLRTPMYQS